MTNFLIEVVPGEQAALGARSISVEGAVDAVREVGKTIASTCESVFAAVRADLEDAMPTELELEFGVSLSAEGGIPLVGKLGTGATFKVTAKWTSA